MVLGAEGATSWCRGYCGARTLFWLAEGYSRNFGASRFLGNSISLCVRLSFFWFLVMCMLAVRTAHGLIDRRFFWGIFFSVRAPTRARNLTSSKHPLEYHTAKEEGTMLHRIVKMLWHRRIPVFVMEALLLF